MIMMNLPLHHAPLTRHAYQPYHIYYRESFSRHLHSHAHQCFSATWLYSRNFSHSLYHKPALYPLLKVEINFMIKVVTKIVMLYLLDSTKLWLYGNVLVRRSVKKVKLIISLTYSRILYLHPIFVIWSFCL